MTGRGRPVRFLALVAVGWVGARFALLWHQTGSLPEAIRQTLPITARASPARGAAPALPAEQARRLLAARASETPFRSDEVRRAVPAAAPEADPARVQMAMLALVQYGAPQGASFAAAMPLRAATIPERLAPLPARWSASAWLVARPGTGLGAAPGGSQLGGSQAGLRVAYLLVPEQRLAAVGRVVTPLRGEGAEASIGLEWQPTRLPVRVVAEHRFGLDGTAGGPGLGVVGGFDGAGPGGFRLESYGQAGAIQRRRTEPYADGAVRLTRVLADGGGMRLALGAGAWGAAQRDAARLDAGPSATLALPLGRQTVRLALDWRQRIAGDARPGSGPALTLGSDF